MQFKRLRMLKNITQDEIASQLCISRSTVAMWESGESMPRTDKLPQLAKIFGCTIDELFVQDEGAESGETP